MASLLACGVREERCTVFWQGQVCALGFPFEVLNFVLWSRVWGYHDFLELSLRPFEM